MDDGSVILQSNNYRKVTSCKSLTTFKRLHVKVLQENIQHGVGCSFHILLDSFSQIPRFVWVDVTFEEYSLPFILSISTWT